MGNSSIKYRVVCAGGGTGGHIYPLLAVVNELKNKSDDYRFLFVGSGEKIEARVVPANGYDFKSIPVIGFARKLTLKNLMFPFRLIYSLIKSLVICFRFKPHVAIGSGAYVSGPVMWAARVMGAKVVLLEQNVYPGITNRLLERYAEEIHISFDETKKYFREQDKLKNNGNPVRSEIKLIDKVEAKKKLGINPEEKLLLFVGGSLGASSINKAVAQNLDKLVERNIEVIWQSGKIYYDRYKHLEKDGVKISAFIDDMSTAYSAADLIVARAGATTLAELTNVGKAVVFIPSPNVAADHQYKNAKALEEKKAAIVLKDNEAGDKLYDVVTNAIFDDELLEELRVNIKYFARPDALGNICDSITKILRESI